MYEWVRIRDIGNGWEVFEQKSGERGSGCFRVQHRDGKAPILDGVSVGWHQLVREMTVMDIVQSMSCAAQIGAKGRDMTEIMKWMIEHAVRERRWAHEAGMRDGIARERQGHEVAASAEMQLLKHHACEILGAESASDPDCPALAGWIRGTKRRATKGVFVTLEPVDRHLRDRLHEAMERAGHVVQGTRDGVGRQVPHAIVVAPRLMFRGFGIGRDELLVRHDVFGESLERAGLAYTEGGLVQAAEASPDAAMTR